MTYVFPSVLRDASGSRIMNATQDATQHLISIFQLFRDRRFDETHGGKLQLGFVFTGGGSGRSEFTEGFSSSAMVREVSKRHGSPVKGHDGLASRRALEADGQRARGGELVCHRQ